MTKGWTSTSRLPTGRDCRSSRPVSKGTNNLLLSMVNAPSDKGMIVMVQSYELAQHHLPVDIESDHDEQHDTKGQQGSTPIADKGQGDPDNRGQPHRHTNIDDDMEEQHTGHPIGIAPAKDASLSLGNGHDTHEQQDIDAQKEHTADKAEPLPDRAKDEVG